LGNRPATPLGGLGSTNVSFGSPRSHGDVRRVVHRRTAASGLTRGANACREAIGTASSCCADVRDRRRGRTGARPDRAVVAKAVEITPMTVRHRPGSQMKTSMRPQRSNAPSTSFCKSSADWFELVTPIPPSFAASASPLPDDERITILNPSACRRRAASAPMPLPPVFISSPAHATTLFEGSGEWIRRVAPRRFAQARGTALRGYPFSIWEEQREACRSRREGKEQDHSC
jgi:hypothetical protein